MRPKGKLFALLAIFAAIGLVTATGAFTSVSAERTAQVQVAGDADALLQLQPHNGPNGDGEYATLNNNQLEINLAGVTGSTVSGSGPNLNATTDIVGVFNITNAGSQAVDINISDAGPNDNDELVVFYNGTHANWDSGGLEEDDSAYFGAGSSYNLGTGETIVISIYVDTTQEPGLTADEQLISNVTITATTSS